MRTLPSTFSSVVLFLLCVMCPCDRSDAQGVPTPAQIITDDDWIVEKDSGNHKSGDKFVMRFDKTKRTYKTIVIEPGDTVEDIEKKRRALDLKDPEGKWSSQNGKILTERFIGKWRNKITVNGKNSFKMSNTAGDNFSGKRMVPIPPAAPPAP